MVAEADLPLELLECQDYPSFIRLYREARARFGAFSYAMIARRAGFSSRSFPRDVAMGEKRLSASSLEKMVKGLGLRGLWGDYFRCLVYLEQPQLRTPLKSQVQIARQLENVRHRLKGASVGKQRDPYVLAHFPLIYAACSGRRGGASVEEITRKTGLPFGLVLKTLKGMEEMSLVRQVDQKFIADVGHLFFPDLKQSHAFRNFFQLQVERVATEAQRDFESDEKLFFASCFSVRASRLKELKSELTQVLLSYVDASEAPEGDKIAVLVCSIV